MDLPRGERSHEDTITLQLGEAMRSPTVAVRSAAAVTVLVSAVLLVHARQAGAAPSPGVPPVLPTSGPFSGPGGITCGYVPFDSASLEPKVIDATSNQHVMLTVQGHNATAGYGTALIPVMYESRPAYRQVGVVGCGPRNAPRSPTTYVLTLDMTVSRGTAGVEVVGANRTQRVSAANVPPPTPTPPTPTWVPGPS
jgi:hypothetical protein